MLEDIRYGARMLVKHPGFTIVAALSLAVGIGATTTVFGLLNAMLLRPLPVKDAATLVSVHKPGKDGTTIHTISHPDYFEYRVLADAPALAVPALAVPALAVFSDVIAWTEAPASVELNGQVEQTYGMLASGNYFPVLGVRPALGRLFTPEEDRTPGEHPVVVLSFAFWQGRFASDSSIVGRSVALNGHPFTVIGVTPNGFTSTYGAFAPSFYAPLMMQGQLIAKPDVATNRGHSNLKVTARLKPGVTLEQAQAALNVLDKQLEASYPQIGESSLRPNLGVELAQVGAYPPDMLIGLLGVAAFLLGIVGCVLLIACANVAGMLLARATVRRREIAVRLAVGATRGRLIRQLLTESSLLFLTAGTLGVLLTVWLTGLISAIPMPVAIPFALEAQVDGRVLGFTLILALVTGVVFGLAPALEASRTDLQSALKDATSAGRFKRSRLRHGFVVAQIALSLVLLIGAGLLARALSYGQTVYPGRAPETVFTATVDPGLLGYDVPQARVLFQRLNDNLQALPGVEAVSMVRGLDIGDGFARTELAVEDAPELGNMEIETNTIAPGYFRTLGVRLISGRDFAAADREGAPRVVIINQAMVRRFWPNASPLGKRVRFGEDKWAEIVGVAEDGRHRVAGQSSPPFVYGAFLQSSSDNPAMTLLVRFRGDKASLLADVRRATRELDPRLPLQSPMTLSAAVETVTLRWRVAGSLAQGFGLLGLALAALGIYGLVAYTVSQRTREIGVRIALGATSGNIRSLVVGHGVKLALLGVAIGLVLSFGVTRALAAFLFGVSASDPITYVGTALVLAAVAMAASYIPARNATRTDPLVALRQD